MQVVDLNDFREAVKTFSLGLGEPEVVAFFNGFDADGSGGIDFEVRVCSPNPKPSLRHALRVAKRTVRPLDNTARQAALTAKNFS